MADVTNSFQPPSSVHGLGLYRRDDDPTSKAQSSRNISITAFVTALNTAIIVCVVQILIFVLLRNRLARIFKPRTYLVPERERTDPPPANAFAMLRQLVMYDDRKIINKCGLDAYFFLRYLKTLLVIFIPICSIVLPILIPINFIGGKGHQVDAKPGRANNSTPSGLDTLAWGNVSPQHTSRYAAHLILAICVVIWVCTVFFFEMRVYIKVRQDYLTSAEHRLRASATTVLVNAIPDKWLTVDALMGLFDVFPGGVRNVWLNRDLTKLLDKIDQRGRVHSMLESAETDLIKDAKKAQLKQRDSQEKKKRKQQNIKAPSKQERAARNAQHDAEASRLANSGEGTNAGSQDNTMDSTLLSASLDMSDRVSHELETVPEEGWKHTGSFATHGVKKSLSKVGRGVRGAATKASNEVSSSLSRSHGFMPTVSASEQKTPLHSSGSTRAYNSAEQEQVTHLASKSLDTARTHSRSASAASEMSTTTSHRNSQMTAPANTVRKLASIDDMYVQERTRFWQFWKPPSGAYTSPVPQGETPRESMEERSSKEMSSWQRIKTSLPFMGEDEEKVEYPLAHAPDLKPDADEGAEWAKYIKTKNRPTHRLPPFGVNWLPGLPWFNKKVDSIYWCREELARLNLEIEEDQKHPERFPLMRSAFIQFNHQVAAHMACQSVVHHIPRQMAPRMNEISPQDVMWENMALSWWQAWLRSAIVIILVSAMILLWTPLVAWTAVLSQLDKTLRQVGWLGPFENSPQAMNIIKGLSGVLPAIFLAVVLLLAPMLLRLLATFKGAKTGAQRSEFVQVFFFIFLFVQVFLVVSIASFFSKSVLGFVKDLGQRLQSVTEVLDILALNLPASANYFFSYMILQGMSTSAGTLLQVASLFIWFVVAPMLDNTPRNKWSRNTTLKQVEWDSLFPVYTNFACIGLVYCVTAPLISIFVVITFSLLWVAQRYTMLYVCRFETDTGGVLYPRAINQTFTGLYFMELCMAGLFLIVQNEKEKRTCTAHGVVMIVVFLLTALYQILLNVSFSPLLRYLPITFEDEAVLRDEAFQRAQDLRFSTARDEARQDVSVDSKGRESEVRLSFGDYRRRQRQRDLEDQRAIGDALYGGVPDDIEDLTPEQRDALTRHAFHHYALRARRPTVWIPRDDLGVSDDEIQRTREYSENIWISNEGTALDSKVRVVYGKNPPDFSEADIINL
ncbi:hypothetical protein XA68_12285 [Ophiocordyceps unilateralis]|uniref:CSC1/OSCA1-like 7TM region domain-containing protein n=1 Tax=Ophiocordyceps unilateralis TaxID=268505 RepID=A0A2A9PF62_OPHUN|nr:hypothetical protein XA68_12285 [Ophiocordyceps unilateralis]